MVETIFSFTGTVSPLVLEPYLSPRLDLLTIRNQIQAFTVSIHRKKKSMLQNIYRVVFLMMMIFQWACHCDAFEVTSATFRRRFESSTALKAWSLPNPTIQSSFGSLTNTWYNEVKNPTARATVYNDVPIEYKFVRLGDDWPSSGERSSVPDTVKPRNRISIPKALRRLVRGRRANNQS